MIENLSLEKIKRFDPHFREQASTKSKKKKTEKKKKKCEKTVKFSRITFATLSWYSNDYEVNMYQYLDIPT